MKKEERKMLDSKLFTFLKVVEKKSYTAAAEELHLTQPAVTQHIKKLEEYYQCRFIEISGKVLSLTREGEFLYHYANMQLANEKQLKTQIQEMVLSLHIGATLSIADYYLPSLLKKYVQEENRNFTIAVGNTETLLEKLIHGELDCAFIEGIFDTNLFESAIFCKAKFIPVAAASHPLKGKEVSLSELSCFPLILREAGSGTRAILENYLYQKNCSVHSFPQILEIGSFGLIKQLLCDSQAVTFLYEKVAQREIEQGELCQIYLKDFSICRPLHFVYLKNSMAKKKYELFFENLAKK